MANPLDIPVVFLVKIGDSDPVEVASGQIQWPYDPQAALQRLFWDAAEGFADGTQGS